MCHTTLGLQVRPSKNGYSYDGFGTFVRFHPSVVELSKIQGNQFHDGFAWWATTIYCQDLSTVVDGKDSPVHRGGVFKVDGYRQIRRESSYRSKNENKEVDHSDVSVLDEVDARK